jgi:hypothetical protein
MPGCSYHAAMRFLLIAVAAATFAGVPAQAQDHTRFHGAWQGPFLFYVVQQDNGAQGAPQVHAGSLRIDADGTVRGSVPDAACTISGSGVEYVSPANASLALTLSGCADARFNGHFTGRLINNPALRYASLRLSSMRSLDAGIAHISSIMER